jgi:glycosyltransferase involved in cell wall biosynthesis
VKVAFVSPFFGADAKGGAESECRNTALHLAASGIDVEILTTCSIDLHHDWNINHRQAGTFKEDGMTIHRFKTEPINLRSFQLLNERIIQGDSLTSEEEDQFIAMHMTSFDLYRFLSDNGNNYDWICFIPYLFGTSVHGSLIHPEKSILIPCLHDEGYAKMKPVNDLFQRVAKIVFHTNAEYKIGEKLYGDLSDKSVILGEGIDTDLTSDGERFRKQHNITDPFVMYAGRKDSEKNVDTLIRYFTAYKQTHDNNLKLVMVGPSTLPVPPSMKDYILDLGFIPIQEKNDAYSAATVLCQPSLNESFSIVMMESWLCQTPCLVHEGCAVTREHIVKSGGGLFFENYADFEGCLEHFLANPDTTKTMGTAGKDYVMKNFAWNKIVNSFNIDVFTK